MILVFIIVIGTVNLLILILSGSGSFGYCLRPTLRPPRTPWARTSGTGARVVHVDARQDAPLLFAHYAVSIGVVHVLISGVSAVYRRDVRDAPAQPS